MKTISEIIEAKKIAESKINTIISQFSHDYGIYDIDVVVDITTLKCNDKTNSFGCVASTKIKINS